MLKNFLKLLKLFYERISFFSRFLSGILHLVFNFLDLSFTGGVFQFLLFLNNNLFNDNKIITGSRITKETTASPAKIEFLIAKDSKEITEIVPEKKEEFFNKKIIFTVFAVLGSFAMFLIMYSNFPAKIDLEDIPPLAEAPEAAPAGVAEAPLDPVRAQPRYLAPNPRDIIAAAVLVHVWDLASSTKESRAEKEKR